MSIYDSKQWIADLDKIIETVPELSELENKSVMITGASGLICSAIADILIRYNETHSGNIIIIAAGRSAKRMKVRYDEFYDRDYFKFVEYDASKANNRIDVKADYIIHGASNASPDTIIAEPVETMLSNFVGLKFLLDYAKNNNSKRLLYISSSEVYGKKDNYEPFREDEYGFVDLLNPRACYPSGKRAAETLCAAYWKEYGLDNVIVRPGHIYGPTATDSDSRASAQFARDVIDGHDIVMKSDGTQLRSYCYVIDCATAIFTVLLKGKSAEAYNISNRDSVVSIRQIAEVFAAVSGKKVIFENPTDSEQKSYNLMDNSSLNAEKLEALGWKANYNINDGVKHTIEILKS